MRNAGEGESGGCGVRTPVRAGEGMRRLTRENCDLLVRIPVAGEVESLNVSVSAGVCLFESVRRRLNKS